MNRSPLLKNFSTATQFWMLLIVFILCLGVSSIIATLSMFPFVEISALGDLNKLSNYSNSNLILGLKIAQTISTIGAFIAPALIFSFLVSPGIFKYLKLNTLPKPSTLLITGLIMLTATPLINWMGELNSKLVLPNFMDGIEQWMKESEQNAAKITEAFLKMDSIGDLLINLIIIALLAAIAEEFFFRGVLQKVIIQWTKNTHKGVWITAILFSAFHLQFYGFLPRMVMGVFLGYLFVWSNSLWVPIVAHFVNNGAAVLLAYFAQGSAIAKDAENVGSGEDEIIFILISALIVIGLLFLLFKIEKNKTENKISFEEEPTENH